MSEEDKIEELESQSQMLCQIASASGEWCEHDECTTLEAVQLMKAEIYELRAYKIRNEIYRLWRD